MAYLDNIKVFVRVYELGSLSVAARDMHLSPAAVSNRIKELEKSLGVRLFNRTTRHLSPTVQGEAFFEGALKILETINAAESSVYQLSSEQKGSIKVMAPLSFGRKIVAPAIPEFRALYPNIQVRLRLTNHEANLMKEGVDVAFHLGEVEDSSLRMRGLLACGRVVCAAPSYLAARGTPSSPQDLIDGKHDCLLFRFAGSSDHFWHFKEQGTLKKYLVAGPIDADDSEVLTRWAVAGLGILNKPHFEVQEQLERGELVQILPSYETEMTPISALYPHKRYQDPKIKLFIDFIGAACRKLLAPTEERPKAAQNH